MTERSDSDKSSIAVQPDRGGGYKIMKPVAIIGMGLSPEDLTTRHRQIIEAADILVGGQRLLDFFEDTSACKQVIDKNIAKAVDLIKQRMATQSVVVLASGDPLFFGIGSILGKALGPENVVIYPNISSVAAAFARIKEPWSNVRVVSLHGRKDDDALFKALRETDAVAVFTDPAKNPAWVAGRLLAQEFANCRMCVFESLGTDAERFNWYNLEQASKTSFSEPNLVVIKRNSQAHRLNQIPHLGLPDNYFVHEKGLISKSEIRAISLAKLQLLPDHVLWDLGAGSGSVSIEAAWLARRGKIIALEKNPARIEQIKINMQQFGITNMEVVQAVLPDGLAGLPQPDRIFIGGGGRNLAEIIQAAVDFLKSNGIVVINTVLMPNVVTAMETLEGLGLKTSMVQAQISHSRKMPWAARLEAQNPVWIVSGRRRPEDGSGK
jgi:precorrin-6Y C5,15-methyltransferase (decarboxylating)